MESRQVEIAAEAYATYLLAREGYDVFIQYGPNQPGYDLVANKGSQSLKVSVKGSQDGSWGLTQTFKRGRTYAAAADLWVKKHARFPDLVVFLVQFKASNMHDPPRTWIARPEEIAEVLKCARGGHGETILRIDHTFRTGRAKGCTDRIPDSWRFSPERLEDLAQGLSSASP